MSKDWNPHVYIVAAVRRIWGWSPERKAASKRAETKDGKQRKCAVDDKWHPRKMTQIDHIITVGKQPRSWEEYPGFLKRLFCPADQLQCLCREHHKIKTRKDMSK